MKTFGDVLDEHRGLGPGFDFLRIFLAYAVILYHCFPIGTGSTDPVKLSMSWAFAYSILPMFFTLSGFLVTGSALRLPLGKFALSRVLRIVPALAVDTMVTILIIGPVFTILPLAVYFTHPETFFYLGNIVGEIHFFLPGVFLTNPYEAVVNGSLWTIPPELGCYVAMAGLIFTGLVHRPIAIAGIAAAYFAVMLVAYHAPADMDFPGRGWFVSPGAKLVPCFLIGALFYTLRHRIPFHSGLLVVGLVMLLGAGLLDSRHAWDNAEWVILSSPVLAYIVLYLGMVRLPLPAALKRGDYSYGVYLYGFPIQQSIVALTGPIDPFLLFALTVLPVLLLAMFSWHIVEKPMLRFRKGFSFSAKRQVASSPE